MSSTTVEQVNEAARKYLDPDLFAIVCLADFNQVELVVPA